MSLHPDHALFVAREQHRQDLLAVARQERLAALAGRAAAGQRPHPVLATFRALWRHLAAVPSLVMRARPASAAEPPAPSAVR